MRTTWKMQFKTEQRDGDLYCKSSTLCTCASLMCHTVMLPLLFGIKNKIPAVSRKIPLLAKREAQTLKSIWTRMLLYTTGQITSFHIILQGCSGGENLTWKLQHSLHEHKLLHHTDYTVQLFSPQPESSHKKDRTEEKEKKGVETKPGRQRERKTQGGWGGGRSIITADSLLQLWLRIKAESTGTDKQHSEEKEQNWEKNPLSAGWRWIPQSSVSASYLEGLL